MTTLSISLFQARLFDGLDDENEYGTTETFVPRRSIKKLVINKSNSQVWLCFTL